MAPAGVLVHLLREIPNHLAQLLGEVYWGTTSRLSIEQRPLRNLTAQHLLQTHGLGAQLKLIGTVLLGPAPLVLHRKGLPQPFLTPKGNAPRGEMCIRDSP